MAIWALCRHRSQTWKVTEGSRGCPRGHPPALKTHTSKLRAVHPKAHVYQPAFPHEFPCILHSWLQGTKEEVRPWGEVIGSDSSQRACKFCHCPGAPWERNLLQLRWAGMVSLCLRSLMNATSIPASLSCLSLQVTNGGKDEAEGKEAPKGRGWYGSRA